MNEYTVCILFDDVDLSRILMCLKDRTCFAGTFNGVGGKVEPGETALNGARREIQEETGATLVTPLLHVTSVTLEDHTGKPDAGPSCKLHIFTASVGHETVAQQPGETELLAWIPTETVFSHPRFFAGGMPGFVHAAKACMVSYQGSGSKA